MTTPHRPNQTIQMTWSELELFHDIRSRMEHSEAHGVDLSAEDCAMDEEELARVTALGQKLDTLSREDLVSVESTFKATGRCDCTRPNLSSPPKSPCLYHLITFQLYGDVQANCPTVVAGLALVSVDSAVGKKRKLVLVSSSLEEVKNFVDRFCYDSAGLRRAVIHGTIRIDREDNVDAQHTTLDTADPNLFTSTLSTLFREWRDEEAKLVIQAVDSRVAEPPPCRAEQEWIDVINRSFREENANSTWNEPDLSATEIKAVTDTLRLDRSARSSNLAMELVVTVRKLRPHLTHNRLNRLLERLDAHNTHLETKARWSATEIAVVQAVGTFFDAKMQDKVEPLAHLEAQVIVDVLRNHKEGETCVVDLVTTIKNLRPTMTPDQLNDLDRWLKTYGGQLSHAEAHRLFKTSPVLTEAETGWLNVIDGFLREKQEPILSGFEAETIVETIRRERDPKLTFEMELIRTVSRLRPDLVSNRLTQLLGYLQAHARHVLFEYVKAYTESDQPEEKPSDQCYYPDTFAGGMTKAADIASLMACSTDDQHRREMQLWVAREIRASRDGKLVAVNSAPSQEPTTHEHDCGCSDCSPRPEDFDFARVQELEKAVALLNCMVKCGEQHSAESLEQVDRAMGRKPVNSAAPTTSTESEKGPETGSPSRCHATAYEGSPTDVYNRMLKEYPVEHALHHRVLWWIKNRINTEFEPDISVIESELKALIESQATRSTISKIDWVGCPICGCPDMKRETDHEGNCVIHCVNHACASNAVIDR